MATKTCPVCNGKGFHKDGAAWALGALTVVFLVPLFFGKDDPDSLGNEECSRCNGYGEIRVREDKLNY